MDLLKAGFTGALPMKNVAFCKRYPSSSKTIKISPGSMIVLRNCSSEILKILPAAGLMSKRRKIMGVAF